MKTVTHLELCYYIKNRIKMILSKSIQIIHIKIGVNKLNTSFIVHLEYEFCNNKETFIKQYKLNNNTSTYGVAKNNLDKSIYQAINDFDKLMN